MGTKQMYTFNTYKILEQDEKALSQDTNPFAIVVLTVLMAIKNKKTNDEDLLKLKTDLFRSMYARNMDKTSMRALAGFLKMYVHFSKPESYRIFDNEIKTITNNNITMGIEELVLHLTEQKGIEKGIEKGLEEGLEKGIAKGIEEGLEKGNVKEVRNLITKLGLSDEQAADVAGVTIEFVKQVRATLKEQ
jgi:hypothetical protein